jgi:2-keto-3-deoxy-6-phosphogluconate aldolase
MDTTDLFSEVRVVPVAVIEDVTSAVPLPTLRGAGIGAIEVTLRSEAAFFPTGDMTLSIAREFLALPNVRCETYE